VQAVIGAIAFVGFERDGNGTVMGHRQLVDQLPEVRTMICAETANQLHGPAIDVYQVATGLYQFRKDSASMVPL
jgi:hypothetical protein